MWLAEAFIFIPGKLTLVEVSDKWGKGERDKGQEGSVPFPPHTALLLDHSHAALKEPAVESEGEGYAPALLLPLLNHGPFSVTYLTKQSLSWATWSLLG